MTIRIASFNMENLFTRPSAMVDGMQHSQEAIDDHAVGNSIIEKQAYSQIDKDKLLALDEKYHFSALNPPVNALVLLNKVRGKLYSRSNAGVVSVVASGRDSWTGWFELRRQDVSWDAVQNTGRVIDAVMPDILVCVEVEDRPTLLRFNEQVLEAVFKRGFPHVMVIDGNDMRGIDVGIMSRFPIKGIRSHVDDLYNGRRVFSRDCPEYQVELEGGKKHFKSKRGGDDPDAQALRLAQGTRAAEIARDAEKNVTELVLVAGDLNDTPDSPALRPLLAEDWTDLQSHADWPKDRPGTYGTGTAANKIDFLIMSKALHATLKTVGVERRGTYHPNLWPHFAQVTANTEASDHHCIWADFDLA
jgi:endonuclease/exonuclease/phosphatase family metal-dependent hydrolase